MWCLKINLSPFLGDDELDGGSGDDELHGDYADDAATGAMTR